MHKKLFLLDGMALTYRAYFSMIRNPLMSSKGMNTSAIFGFVNSLNKLLEDETPDYIAVAFDTDQPTFRHKMYTKYKSTRQAMPDDLVPQISKIKEIVGAFNIPMLEFHGYEADDIIGTLVRVAEKENVWSYIVTADKDFYQLVNSKIRVYKPARSISGRQVSDIEVIDEEAVKQRFGVGPDHVIDVLGLMGDTVDCVPGIKGIGEKTAVALISEYNSLEGLYENIDKVTKPKLKENLIQYKADAFLSRQLVTINTNMPLKIDFHQLTASEKNITLLEKIYTELEFRTLLKRLMGSSEQSISIKPLSVTPAKGADTDKPEPTYKVLEDIKSRKHDYKTLKTESELKQLATKLRSVDEFAFRAEITGTDPLNSDLIGLSFAYNENEAFYIPLRFKEKLEHTDMFGLPDVKQKKGELLPMITPSSVVKHLKDVFEDRVVKKVGYNIKCDILALKNLAINVENIGFDSMLAAYILKPESSYKLELLSENYLNYRCIPLSELIAKQNGKSASMETVPYLAASEYAAENADSTLRLYHRLEYELKKVSLDNLCSEVEFPLIEVLADMEFYGVKVDEKFLSEMNVRLAGEEKRLEREICESAGEEFNVNSTKQLSHILFDKLKLNPSKKIKTGFSTDVGVLEELIDQHPIAVKLLDYRVITKLRSTYTEGLLKIINKKTGKVHTSFNQTVAATGRLSSTNPNLQNIPIRTDIGRELRKAFIPEKKGDLILSADYSQIELRIMAHLANEDNMVKAFERKHDIHAETASRIFKVKSSQVDHNMRRKAKEVNFGIIYGIQAFGLSSRLDIEQHEAREIIQKYFKEYPGINSWLEKTKVFAREKGYTETLAGRRRFLPNINNKNAVVRQRDERIAINMPVQGTAADMIKIAMINIHQEFKKEKMKSKMILQVHDELVFDCAKEEIDEVERIVSNKMKHALKLNVPIDVEVGIGGNWFEAHS
jgi:DNA polymerase I